MHHGEMSERLESLRNTDDTDEIRKTKTSLYFCASKVKYISSKTHLNHTFYLRYSPAISKLGSGCRSVFISPLAPAPGCLH